MRPLEFARKFSDKSFGEMVDYLNSFIANGFTLKDNMSGQIVSVVIPAGVEIKVPHRLKAVPKYRIILRQDANTVIYDGGEWTDTFITLNAASDVSATILLMRG